MSVSADERGAEGQPNEGARSLQIYLRLSQQTIPCCTARVSRETTAATVVQATVAALGLDTSKRYDLVEVRAEGEGQEQVLQPSDLLGERARLWPTDSQDPQGPLQGDGCFFVLRVADEDEGYVPSLAERGFVSPRPEEDCSDLCHLPVLTEDSILDTLRRRFLQRKIYTFAGNILIAINPFQFLPIYNPKYVKMYRSHAMGQKEPHIFATADAAFSSMLSKHTDQCIVISGESGSGKTQSSNFLLHCLTSLSQKGYTSGVERTILGAGPVLEAFGNAKTAYNNNSSRFGKFIQVNYLESGVVRGAVVEKYLLEKSRLVARGASERNYHVFYYLLLGASEEERKEFSLLQPEDYHYLRQENLHFEDKEEIELEFRRLHQALEMVGFLPATKKQIFSVLSAILYLGNVTCESKEDGHGVEVGPVDVLLTLSGLLKVRQELLEEALTQRKAMTANDTLILPYSLNEAITARDSMAKSLYSALFDWIVLRVNHALLNKRDLEESVQCLSIGVLDIFGFENFNTNSFEQFCINYTNEQLQYYCNQYIFTIEQGEYQTEGIVWDTIDYTDNISCISLFSKKPTGLFYLLDEESNFPHANNDTLLEKFKQVHHENCFFVPTAVLEPAFIIKHFAGKVKYQIKDFREKNMDHMRPDLVALLRSSERGFLRQLIGTDPVAVFRWGILRAAIRSLAAFKQAGKRWASQSGDKAKLSSRRSLGNIRRPSMQLDGLKSHSSLIEFSFDRSEDGPLEVFEDIFATFEKKREMHAKILRSITQLGGQRPHKMRVSAISHRRSRLFFQKQRASRHKQIIPKKLTDSRSLTWIVNLTLHNSSTRGLLHPHQKKKPPSISAQFQTSLSKLLDTLSRAEPLFVRCVRSNAEKRELYFEEKLVQRQLRYTGMLETVRIRRSGYGAKYTFQEFTDHFRVLLPKKMTSPQEDIRNLLRKKGLGNTSFQIGRTKVFLKEGERQRLQEARHQEVMRCIVTLQRWFRACLTRMHYLAMRQAAITIQRSWRAFQERRRWRAALVIQEAWRDSHQRAEYLSQRESFHKMQRLVKGSSNRRRRQSQLTTPPAVLEEDEVGGDQTRTGAADESEQNQEQAEPGRSTGAEDKPEPVPSTSPGGTAGSDLPGGPRSQGASKEEKPLPKKPPPVLVRPLSLPSDPSPMPGQNGTTEPQGAGSLQRYTQAVAMREKAERWRERRTMADEHSPETLRPQDRRIEGLQTQGRSISLDNLKSSSSESDSSTPSPSNTEVRLRSRRRVRRRRRLAHARSGLMFNSGVRRELEYWSFPLPPISPAQTTKDSTFYQHHSVPEFQRSSVTDGGVASTARHTGQSPQTQPEKIGFFSKILKKRQTPQDVNVTVAKMLAERGDQDAGSPRSHPPALPRRTKRNPTVKISRATRVQETWNASLEREITDTKELRHLDEFLGNQINDLRTRMNDLSGTEHIFLKATMEFRETIKNMYSLSKPHIGYKGLMASYQTKVGILAGRAKASEVQLVVNLFQSVLDGFIRGEVKRAEAEPVKVSKKKKKKRRKKEMCPDSPLDHLFSTYQVNIVQSCDLCGSFIWGMERACMCSSCKMVCHNKCLGKIITGCAAPSSTKTDVDQQGSKHFGVLIRYLSNKSTPVPVVMEIMLEHVEMNGLYTEGIYRKSGSACRARELHKLLETDPQKAYLENYPIHTITGLIKSWLRELPDPLMTYNLYNDFIYAAELPETADRLRAIYRKLEELPPCNFNTLERLVFHLVRVAKEEAHNRMSANSLAIVFAPCLLRCPDTSDPFLSMKDLGKTTLCVEILINEQSRRYNEKMEEIQHLEHVEELAVNQLKLRRQNTVCDKVLGDVDSSSLERDKLLIERIQSIKQEKEELACRLPELDHDTSDNMDSESSVSSESLLEDQFNSLDSEGPPTGQRTTDPSSLRPKCPPKELEQAWQPSAKTTCTENGEGILSPCVFHSEDRPGRSESSPSSSGKKTASSKGIRRYSELDIPFIDEEV